MKNSIKIIRISLFAILLLMLGGCVIIKYIDNMKMRVVLFVILCIAVFLLEAILAKSPKCAIPRVMILDFLNSVIFIGLIVIFISLTGRFGEELSEINKIQNAFQGNNVFLFSYSDSIGAKRYKNLESAVRDAIKYRKKSLGQKGLKEIYRIQVGEKAFIYLKETEDIVEVEFFQQDDLYYCAGSKALSYTGLLSSDSYIMEETMKKDIANTMWRGIGYKEVGAPAWGVTDDEQIFSTTINGAKMDDVIQIDEIDGKKYYFWITTNLEGIETIDDVKEIKIENAESEERTNEEYVSILLDNKEDFDYVARMMQQCPPGSYIDFNEDNSITSGSQEITDEIENNEEFYGHLKNLMDLGEVWYVIRATSSLDEKDDSIMFEFSNPPKDCHGGWHYWDDAEEGDYYTKRLIIDEHWTLGVIPNI